MANGGAHYVPQTRFNNLTTWCNNQHIQPIGLLRHLDCWHPIPPNLRQKEFAIGPRTHSPICVLSVVTKPEGICCKMPSKAPKDDGTEEQEATASLAASKEISSVDVAVVAALSDGCYFHVQRTSLKDFLGCFPLYSRMAFARVQLNTAMHRCPPQGGDAQLMLSLH